MTELELLIRKSTLKDVEIWLNKQYAEIDKELLEFVEDRNDDSARFENYGLSARFENNKEDI